MSDRSFFHKLAADLSCGLPKTKYYIFFRHTKNPMGVSFPKSGRTWVRKMLLDLSIKIPFSHAGSNNYEYGYPTEFYQSQKFFANSVIFIARDPRDTLVSYHNDLVWRHKIFSGNLLEMAKNPNIGIDAIANFNTNWIFNAEHYRNFMLIRYEDLCKNPEDVVCKLCDFLGAFWISHRNIRTVVEESTFENMKMKELNNEYRGLYPSYWFEGGRPGGVQKVRKGQVGGFKNEMPAHVQEYCNRRLTALQYPADLLCD